jgi:hypothetical protein
MPQEPTHFLTTIPGQTLPAVNGSADVPPPTVADKIRLPSLASQIHIARHAREPASEWGWYPKQNGVMAFQGHRAILPQLVLDGSYFAECDIQPGYDVNEELIRRFDADPHDRLVVACYHLFRTQFANSFTAPELQDCAAFCSCMDMASVIASGRVS